MKARFLDALVIEDLGDGMFMLTEPLRFYSAKLSQIVVAPAGLVTDLASIPPYVPGWLVPKLGDWDYPACIHDAAYMNQLQDAIGNPLIVGKDTADSLFREGLEARGVGRVRRTLMWLAVHFFGRGQFEERTHGPV